MTLAPEAEPQALEDARAAPRYPEIVATATDRGITSIVHFTRTSGLKGILYTSVVMARSLLPEDARVKHVYEENATDRSRDLEWHDYINLSVTDINLRMFKFSKREHPCDEWLILAFDPAVLGEPGVVFCTTNNAYEVARRYAGPRGFEEMFAPRVPWGQFGSAHSRYGRARNQTTDPQAEVLYPHELALDHLHTVIVADEDTYETVQAILYNFPHNPEVVINPEAFR